MLGTMIKIPSASSFLRGKVDETIEKEVKKNLEQTLPNKLADEAPTASDSVPRGLSRLPPKICEEALTFSCRFPVTETFALRFRAILTEGASEVELALV